RCGIAVARLPIGASQGDDSVPETFGCDSFLHHRAFDDVACGGPGPASTSSAPRRLRARLLLQPIFLRSLVRTLGAVVSLTVRIRLLSALYRARSRRPRARQAEQC